MYDNAMEKKLFKVRYRENEFYFDYFTLYENFPDDIEAISVKEHEPYDDEPYKLYTIEYLKADDWVEYLHVAIKKA